MTSKQKLAKTFELASKYSMVLILLLFVVVMIILTPNFLTSRNLLNIVRQVSITGIISLSMTMVIITGGIDLSAGASLAFVCVVTTYVMKAFNMTTTGVVLGILAGLAAGLLIGLIDGYFVGIVKMAPFIVTLAMTSICKGGALVLANGKPIGGLPDSFIFIGQGSLFGVPVPIYIFAVCIIVSWVLLSKAKFGSYIKAIGGNEQAAVTAGINVPKYKLYTYMFHGLMIAVAAIVYTARITSGQPSAGTGFELDAITAAIIGGTSFSGGVGTIFGTVIGALVMGVMNNGLDLMQVSPYYQEIAKGIIIIIAICIDIQKNKGRTLRFLR